LSMADRKAQMDAINAEILTIEREMEFLVRLARKRGVQVGPRPVTNPLAILDIEPVK
jgi:hypothetical protein